ncbi:polyprenol phosphomannose-dependent alpha 1,6 mannosyltransferase MptB [Actinoplanes sp. NPDC026619]|uniref:polyprenol phosphomannose-dependent alpha 1,6 mannosyltransferase MptB n=1 Tax=Actinoplanes sp. NPDC026619 TaxID=3155798 RepID=UPI0033C9C32A
MLRDHTSARAVGFAGSTLIAVGGLGAGALPIGASGRHAQLGIVSVYTGLLLLVLAWWWYGRVAREQSHWGTLAWWAAPLLLAPPLFSRDVYSYLAQGLMIDSGMDVYQHGPALLGGEVADQVPDIWQHTPSPYGPVFLLVARAVAGLLSAHLLLGIIAMRLVAVAGLVLLARALPVLARSAGVSPNGATWLALLNPLVLIHLVGGAHNDALMVGLLAAGLAAAVRQRPILGTVLVVAAALVKWPAALGLFAIVAIWANGRWVLLKVAATAVTATVAITAVAGTGYGWISALATPINTENWSLTGLLGRWTAGLLGTHLAAEAWRWAGLLAMVVVAGVVWTYRARLGPVYCLGIVLTAVVLFGPAIRPWYLVWGLAPLAAVVANHVVRRVLAGFCAVLVLVVLPDGFAADADRLLLAVLGGLIGVAAFLVVRLVVMPVKALR